MEAVEQARLIVTDWEADIRSVLSIADPLDIDSNTISSSQSQVRRSRPK